MKFAHFVVVSLFKLIMKNNFKNIFEISPELTDDTVLYRTTDFFGVAQLVTNKKLMFSRGDVFSDKNEGVDHLLGGLEIAFPKSGCGLGWSNDQTARAIHLQVKRSHFISCWSKNPESVAMWSMYSPDLCSIRMSTKISKLLTVAENFLEKYSATRLTVSNIGEAVVVAKNARVSQVVYRDLPYLMNVVSRKLMAKNRLAARYARKGLTFPGLINTTQRGLGRREIREIDELRKVFNLKDVSFQYEDEVRIAVSLGEAVWSQRLLDEQAFLDPKHKYHSLANDIIRSFGWVDTKPLPEREFIACPENFVESVALDPRCPPHKADFMRNWFKQHGIPVVESRCFGYLPDLFNIYPEW